MKLPLLIVAMLPERWKEKYIQHQWDNKPDTSILDAHTDAQEWIENGRVMSGSETVQEIAKSCQERLDKHIMPQVIKRNLEV